MSVSPSVSKVRFVPFDKKSSAEDEKLFEPVRIALHGNGWATEAQTDTAAQYYVTTDKSRQTYLICQADGEKMLRLRPPVAVDADNAAQAICQRLQHLARFDAVRAIDNFSSVSSLRGKLLVELLALPDHFEDGADDPRTAGTLLTQLPYCLMTTQKACLRISNLSASVLNVVVLDLQPDWGICQIFPANDFEPLEPRGMPTYLPLEASLPEDYERGTDTLKVFATLEPTSFRSLELVPLDRPSTAPRSLRAVSGPLEALLSEFAQMQPRMRNINLSGAPNEWTVNTVEIIVEKPK